MISDSKKSIEGNHIPDYFDQIPKEKKFQTHFSEALELINKSLNSFIKSFTVNQIKYPKKLIRCDEIVSNVIKEWVTMSKFSSHKIVIHVYKMIFSVQKDPEFVKLDLYDKNIILWTCLLHDIAKRGLPLIPGRDHIHPFKGAQQVLHIFKRLSFFDCKKELLFAWDDAFQFAFTVNNIGEDCHDNSKLDEIYRILCEIFPKPCFERDIIVLVLLHQSLPSLPHYAYHIVLKPLYEEVPKYFDLRLLLLMKLIIKHDSLSYLIGGKFWDREEYSKKFDEIINDILKNTKLGS